MQIILARHCQTDWNKEGRVQGQTDIPLNETGRREARELADKLLPFSINHIISSDLIRAQETANIIGNIHQITPRVDPRLRETSYGELEGLSFEEFRQRCGSQDANPYPCDFRPFGGEHSDTVLRRQVELLNEFDFSRDDSTLLVSHGHVFRILLASLEKNQKIIQGSYVVIDHQELNPVFQKFLS